MSVSFTILGQKYCIGYPDFEDNLITCETTSRVSKGNQCQTCMGKDVLSRCTYCKGDCTNAKALSYCDSTPHLVYLAAFTRDFVKVGTTAETRAKRRLLEQGANYARIVARTPTQGLAKRIEAYIKDTFSVPDRRNKRITREALDLHLRADDLASTLDGKIDEIHKEKGEFSRFFVEEPQELDFYSGYCSFLRRKGVDRINVLELQKDRDFAVQGKILFSKGDFLIIDSRDGFVAFNFASKMGNILSNGVSEKTKQLSLY